MLAKGLAAACRNRLAIVLSILPCVACGGSTVPQMGSPDAACAALDGSGSGQCFSNSALVLCGSVTGAHAICLNDRPECSGSADMPCVNVCAQGEYGQECLDIQNPYPAGCHAAPDGIFSAEANYMCCTCPRQQ